MFRNKNVHVLYEAADSADSEIGIRLLDLIESSQNWMHRRVDSIRLDPVGETRIHVSIDMTIPEARKLIYENSKQIVLPITTIQKGGITRLDTGAVNGSSTCVLNTFQNSLCAEYILKACAEKYLPKCMLSRDLAGKLHELVHCPPDTSARIYNDFESWLLREARLSSAATNRADGIALFLLYANNFAHNFLFLVSVDALAANRRIVLKYSRDVSIEMGGTYGGLILEVEGAISDFGLAKSHHIEFRVPFNLKILTFLLFETSADGKITKMDDYLEERGEERHIAQCALAPSNRFSQGQWVIKIAPVGQGILRFTHFASLVLAGLLLAGTVVRTFDLPLVAWDASTLPSPAVSLLLVGPALLLSWLSRAKEHPVLQKTMAPMRNTLLAQTAVLAVLAVLASVDLRAWVWNTMWTGAVLTSLVWTCYFWVLERQVGKMEDVISGESVHADSEKL